MAQVKTGDCVGQGNTKNNACPGKCRNWCFTLNNYSEEDIKTITSNGCEYVFQEETGKSGTKHLQGVLIFKNAVSFKSVKSILPTAHLEKCKNIRHSVLYCSKEDTRTGEVYVKFKKFEQYRHIGTVKTKKVENLFQDNFKKWKEDVVAKAIDELMESDFDLPFPDMMVMRGQFEQVDLERRIREGEDVYNHWWVYD